MTYVKRYISLHVFISDNKNLFTLPPLAQVCLEAEQTLAFCHGRKLKHQKAAAYIYVFFFFCLCTFCYLFISGRPSRPMSERNLPISFFNPSQTDQSQHLQGTFNHSGKPIQMFQQNHNTITHYNRSCHSTGHPGNYDQNGSNFVRTRGIPVSYAQLPTGVVKSVSPGLAPQVAAQPCRAPAPSFPQEVAVQNSDLQSSSMRFNPRYNSLLVQPNVKPHLPVVPGEPTFTKIDEKGKDLEEFPGELLMRRGEN